MIWSVGHTQWGDVRALHQKTES